LEITSSKQRSLLSFPLEGELSCLTSSQTAWLVPLDQLASISTIQRKLEPMATTPIAIGLMTIAPKSAGREAQGHKVAKVDPVGLALTAEALILKSTLSPLLSPFQQKAVRGDWVAEEVKDRREAKEVRVATARTVSWAVMEVMAATQATAVLEAQAEMAAMAD
jgi:hypothetical protein